MHSNFSNPHKFPHFPSSSRIRRVPAAVLKGQEIFLFTFLAFPSVLKGNLLNNSREVIVKNQIFFNSRECNFSISFHSHFLKNFSPSSECRGEGKKKRCRKGEKVFHLTSEERRREILEDFHRLE